MCLNRLRTWACQYMCPTRASRTAVFALDGDPTLQASVAVATSWAREVWESGWDGRALSIPHLRAIFEDGEAARTCRAWATCKGPLSAIALELARLGWSWPLATSFVDDLGVAHDLVHEPPGRLKEEFAASRSRQLCRLLSARVPSQDGLVDPEPVRRVLQGKQLDGRQKGALRRAFQDAVFTLDRMAECGYDLDSVQCPLCRSQPDSLHHRLFECTHPAVAAVREEVLTPALLEECRALDPRVSVQGWRSPDSFFAFPPPATGDMFEQAVVQRAVGGSATEVDWQPCCWNNVRADIRINSDASLFKDDWRSSWRAGWGLVIDQDSKLAFRCFGPVPGPVQTVPVAEWIAVVAAARL